MIVRLLIVLFAAALPIGRAALAGEDWITAPSFYTHDATGRRVAQHTPIGPFYTTARDDVQRSGYRHNRSSLQFGGSSDHYHVVEEWGREVRPYDEWRFPYRPYSVPYEAWGPPFAGTNFGYPIYPFGFGAPPAGIPNANAAGGNPNAPPFPPGGANQFQPFAPYRGFQPWFDDRYPAVDDRAPWRRQPFPVVPEIP